jgi:hypothetical protein
MAANVGFVCVRVRVVGQGATPAGGEHTPVVGEKAAEVFTAAVARFNTSPWQGIGALISSGLCRRDAKDVARFLKEHTYVAMVVLGARAPSAPPHWAAFSPRLHCFVQGSERVRHPPPCRSQQARRRGVPGRRRGA